MKIALVTGRYSPFTGGIETHVKQIATHLAKSRHSWKVEVVTTDPTRSLPHEDVIDGITVRRFKSTVWRDAYYFSPSLESYLKRNMSNYEVIHAHGYHSLVPLHAARAIKASGYSPMFFFTPHYLGTGSDFSRRLLHYPYRLVGRQVFSASKKIISLSRYESRSIRSHFGVDGSSISIIPNGVDLCEIRNLCKTDKREKAVLSVCRLVKYKGLGVLIDAFAKIEGSFRLEIVGEGPFLGSLLRKVDSLGLRKKVCFYQRLPRKQLLQKYVDSSLFVLPSEHEAQPISLLEALAAQTPCIVSDIPPLREWIDDKSCYGIELPINADRLASLMQTVIDKPVQSQTILSWTEVAERLENLYLEEFNHGNSKAREEHAIF